MALTVGSQLGHYHVIALIGEGGIERTHRAGSGVEPLKT